MADIGKQARSAEVGAAEGAAAHTGLAPGKQTLVQRKAGANAEVTDDGAVHQAAAAGVSGSGGSGLPYLDRIQGAFGPQHDVSDVRAHVGGAAAEASDKIGASAYAMGGDVAFKQQPDLHTAAHEAAHVVQQKGGVQLKGGVGAEGDTHERHADAVADRVVRGESAADLLAGHGEGAATKAVQREDTKRPLAADERILSKDPTYAIDGYVPWFAQQVQAKLVPWDLAFDASSVKLATLDVAGAAVKAVVLHWNPTWGTIPTAQEMPLTMRPIDARASVSAVHGLAGWTKVPAGEQTTISALLGAEENALSGATRDHLRPTFKTLKTKTDTEQAAGIQGTLHVKDAMPNWTPETMATAAATVVVSGPVDKPAYAFVGGAVDGEEWTATFSDGIATKIMAPKGPTPGLHNHTVQEIATAAAFMPKAARAVITVILLNPITNPQDPHWAAEYHTPDFHSYMTAGAAGVVTIYPDKVAKALPGADARESAMVHETGHTWSYKTWGQDTTKGKWVEWQHAMDADKVAVSGYATNAIAEDVAETIRTYVSAKGTPRAAEYQSIVPHRWAILVAEYDK